MIKLKHKRPYLSIKKFEETEINDFSLITGLNGVGKTHFLKSIDSGHIIIEGINQQDIIYTNYNDFILKPQTNDNKQQPAQRNTNIYKVYSQKIKAAKTLFDKYSSPLDFSIYSLIIKHYPHEIQELLMIEEVEMGAMYGFPNHSSNSFSQTIGVNKDFENITKYESLAEVKSNKGEFSRQFYLFLNIFLPRNGQINLLRKDVLTQRYNEILVELENLLNQIDSELFQFLKTNTNGTKNVFCLNPKDFEHFNLLASEIAEEVKRYVILELKNDFNELRSKKWGKKYPFLSPKDFIEANGENPLCVLNQVLNEYDCNGYFFKEIDLGINIEQNFNDITIPIQLENKKEGFTTSLNNLSGGEQTLLTLALMIYKARQGKVFPRLLLLDEVDSALHPSVINRLLQVVNTVFVQEKGIKVIMVTHSPTTVAVDSNESIYVLERNPIHKLSLKHKKEAIEFLTDGFATLEAGLKLFDQISHKGISIITEGNNISYLQKANEYFGHSNIEIIKGLENCSGKNQLKTMFDFFSKTSHKNKVVFVWDCDVTFKLEESNYTYPFIFNRNESNKKVLSGIENLFDEVLFLDKHYVTKQKKDGGFHSDLNKPLFEKDILKNGTTEDFKNFKPLFDWLNKI
nr:AAA family ATPase [uncultured Draconibacterium sp.]